MMLGLANKMIAMDSSAPHSDSGKLIKPRDDMDVFIESIACLPSRHPRRLAIFLAQIGLLTAVACFGVSIAGMNIGIMTCLAGCVFAGAPLHRMVAFWVYMVYVAWLYLSLGFNGMPEPGISSCSIPVGLIVAQVAFHPGLPGASTFRYCIMVALVASLSAGVSLALVQFVVGVGKGGVAPFRVDPEGVRFFHSTGFFSIHLTQGAIMGLLFMLVSAIAVGWWRRVGQTAATIGVGICGARGALFGFIAAVSIWIISRGRRYVLIGGGITVLLMLSALGVMRLTQPERLDNLLMMRDGRWPIWQTSLHVIADRPLLGTGGSERFREMYVNKYPQVISDVPNEFPKGAPHAHNSPLSLAAEHGVPFAVIWLVMLLSPLVYLYRGEYVIFRAGLGMVVMAIFFGQFEKLDGATSRVLWTGLGMLLALRYSPSASSVVCNRASVIR